MAYDDRVLLESIAFDIISAGGMPAEDPENMTDKQLIDFIIEEG